MTNSPDWQEVEDVLFEQAYLVLQRMKGNYADTIMSFFAFYAEPIQGLFEIHIDTPENAMKVAMKQEQMIVQERRQMLAHGWSWKQAHYHTDSPRLHDYSYDVTYFQFHAVDTVSFNGWSAFFDGDEYPKGKEYVDDDYLEGNTRIVLWHVTERLIEHNAFSHLRLTSPFRIGYQFYDNELVTLRFLNWPTVNEH